jgi:RNA 2',3'-cyclic 3'-phosphodiesterase
MEMLRAFIAIEIPIEIKTAIANQTAGLRRIAGQAVRWVASENTHLTLKFLGELSPANAGLLAQALQAECDQQPVFEISAGGIGCFPNPRRPRVIWIGLNAPRDLKHLQHNIEAAAARLGYAAEDRPFSAHLTIGRIREQAALTDIKNLQAALGGLKIGELGHFSVKSITLFKSELRPGGSCYTALSHALLGNSYEKEII